MTYDGTNSSRVTVLITLVTPTPRPQNLHQAVDQSELFLLRRCEAHKKEAAPHFEGFSLCIPQLPQVIAFGPSQDIALFSTSLTNVRA